MKYMKKVLVMMLALAMILSLAISVSAAGTGSVTFEGAKRAESYSIYQLFKPDGDRYVTPSYQWKDFYTLGAGAEFVEVEEVGTSIRAFVRWKQDMTKAENVEAFARVVAAYGSKPTAAPTQTLFTENPLIKFENLPLGYYLVTSSLGTKALIEITEENPNVVVTEKVSEITAVKKVLEGETWGTTSTAKIGDTVKFQITINLAKGADKVKMHDRMGDGLTLLADSIAIEGLEKGVDYKVVDYNVTTGVKCFFAGCDFEVQFDQHYIDTLTEDTTVTVTYDAVLNENVDLVNGVTNEMQVNWGSKGVTALSTTTTSTLTFDIVKTDGSLKVLDGAKFKLFDAQTAGNEIPVVKVSDGVYRVAVAGETGVEIETLNGKATVQGVAGNTTYYLEETAAPEGYNILTARVAVEMAATNLVTTMESDTWAEGDGGVQITNNAGTQMPSTGGMGTTMFYSFGGILVLAAVVLLITKKRMSIAE